jgi:hypothetical protein
VIFVATAFGAFARGHGPAMADVVTWYDVLGIAPGASSETIRRAYVERTKKLEHAQIGHPPPLVIDAIDRGHKALEAAWLVLRDPARRECYDEETGGERRHSGSVRNDITVPDVRGLFFGPCQDALMKAGCRVRAIRLTDKPMPVEGLVVGQMPGPGEKVPRSRLLVVHVWHPPRLQPQVR